MGHLNRIDAHCHVWELSRNDYDWLDVSAPVFEAIARDFDVTELEAEAAKVNVKKFVLVQAAATTNETEFLLSLADKHPSVVGVVGWVDLSAKDAAQRVQQFARHKAFKGIRPMLQDIEDTQWLLNVPDLAIWPLLENAGLRLDALVKPRHFNVLTEFCSHHNTLPVVIDHAAKPDIASANKEQFEQWQACMSTLGKHTNAYCKLSGLLTEMAPQQLSSASTILQPYVDHLVESFGPERLMWGSDWPVVRMAGDYEPWSDLALQLLKGLNDQDKNAILCSTAAKFYGIDEVVS